MRIHRVTLRNYRGVVEREVTFPATGVTIVEGDNETGKSSLPEALRLLFEFPDSSAHRDVKSVQPAGRDVGAEVEAEITAGPYRFTYRKRWHRMKETSVHVHEPRREQLTGKPAHDRVKAILDETVDRDLWHVLWLTQGNDVAPPPFAVPSLGRALDGAAGAERAGEEEDGLWERIRAERDRYWTKTGRPTGDRTSAAAAVEAARVRIEALESELRSLDDAAAEITRLDRHSVTLAEQLADQEGSVSTLTEQAAAIAQHRQEVRRLTLRRDAARSERTRLAAAWHRRMEQLDDLERRTNELHKRNAELELAAPERTKAVERHQLAQEALLAERSRLELAEAAHRLATADAEHRRNELDHAQLVERRDRVEDAQRRLDEAEATLDSIRVDDAVVERIEEAHLAVARAEAAAASSAASVVAEALADVELMVDGRAVRLSAGDVQTVSVGGTLHVTVPGVIRFEVAAGAEARALADRLADARTHLERVCADARVADLAEARAQAARRADAERTRSEARQAIKRDLRDLTLETIRQKIDRLSVDIATHRAERADCEDLPADLDLAEAAAGEAEREVTERRAALRRAQETADHATTALQQVEVDDATLVALATQATSAAEQALRSLEEARADATDDSLRQALRDADEELTAASEALGHAEVALARTDPDTTELLLDNSRDTVDRLRREVTRTDDRRRELHALLTVKGELGLASELDEVRSRLEHLTRDHERLEARAEAALLLHDTFAARRAEATQRHLAPFRDRIEQLGRIVFGQTFEVELDDDLRITRRTLDGTTLEVEQLSVGAREQLGIISRLACAAITSADGGAPIVFDDALGWTDPGRLQRVGAAISVAARDCQVIVLTCTPGRYSAVGGATVVHLDAA